MNTWLNTLVSDSFKIANISCKNFRLINKILPKIRIDILTTITVWE